MAIACFFTRHLLASAATFKRSGFALMHDFRDFGATCLIVFSGHLQVLDSLPSNYKKNVNP